MQQAFVESQATESLLQQVAADSAASTATEVESAAASELAVLLPPHEIIAKENGVESGELILVTGGKPGLKGDTSYLELVRVK